jgi:hypothetical protein
VEQPIRLPEGLTLSRFMYSLTAIWNFGRPWLHTRHKRRMPPLDVATLRDGKIAWDRSVFFGLLASLPTNWREFLEQESRAIRAARHLQNDVARRRLPQPEPVRELLELIEETLLLPNRLAVDVYNLWSEVQETSTLGSVEVVGTGEGQEFWDVGAFLRMSGTQDIETVDANWATISELPTSESLTNEIAWRPHRW